MTKPFPRTPHIPLEDAIKSIDTNENICTIKYIMFTTGGVETIAIVNLKVLSDGNIDMTSYIHKLYRGTDVPQQVSDDVDKLVKEMFKQFEKKEKEVSFFSEENQRKLINQSVVIHDTKIHNA